MVTTRRQTREEESQQTAAAPSPPSTKERKTRGKQMTGALGVWASRGKIDLFAVICAPLFLHVLKSAQPYTLRAGCPITRHTVEPVLNHIKSLVDRMMGLANSGVKSVEL
ncbi:hypothetical protein cyc_04088 [Cyclospora cayetanensis]|uniref:Uncharacterized protein n=1 Tax=Cyclospora cayetanensis TaxID=88456 RepID=A0A1D3CZD0_9EIME|nr:hypothetical protein cyc_04088 [Cyclospora cayetanensis]